LDGLDSHDVCLRQGELTDVSSSRQWSFGGRAVVTPSGRGTRRPPKRERWHSPPPGTWLCTEGIIIHVVQWRIMKGALSLSRDGDGVLDDTTSQESGRNEKQQTNEGTDHHDHHW